MQGGVQRRNLRVVLLLLACLVSFCSLLLSSGCSTLQRFLLFFCEARTSLSSPLVTPHLHRVAARVSPSLPSALTSLAAGAAPNYISTHALPLVFRSSNGSCTGKCINNRSCSLALLRPFSLVTHKNIPFTAERKTAAWKFRARSLSNSTRAINLRSASSAVNKFVRDLTVALLRPAAIGSESEATEVAVSNLILLEKDQICGSDKSGKRPLVMLSRLTFPRLLAVRINLVRDTADVGNKEAVRTSADSPISPPYVWFFFVVCRFLLPMLLLLPLLLLHYVTKVLVLSFQEHQHNLRNQRPTSATASAAASVLQALEPELKEIEQFARSFPHGILLRSNDTINSTNKRWAADEFESSKSATILDQPVAAEASCIAAATAFARRVLKLWHVAASLSMQQHDEQLLCMEQPLRYRQQQLPHFTEQLFLQFQPLKRRVNSSSKWCSRSEESVVEALFRPASDSAAAGATHSPVESFLPKLGKDIIVIATMPQRAALASSKIEALSRTLGNPASCISVYNSCIRGSRGQQQHFQMRQSISASSGFSVVESKEQQKLAEKRHERLVLSHLSRRLTAHYKVLLQQLRAELVQHFESGLACLIGGTPAFHRQAASLHRAYIKVFYRVVNAIIRAAPPLLHRQLLQSCNKAGHAASMKYSRCSSGEAAPAYVTSRSTESGWSTVCNYCRGVLVRFQRRYRQGNEIACRECEREALAREFTRLVHEREYEGRTLRDAAHAAMFMHCWQAGERIARAAAAQLLPLLLKLLFAVGRQQLHVLIKKWREKC